MTRVKVTLSPDTHRRLKDVAHQQRVSLSRLLLDATVARWLTDAPIAPSDPDIQRQLDRQAEAIADLRSQVTLLAQRALRLESSGKGSANNADPKGWDGCTVLDVGDLYLRLKLNASGRANMFQVGGRDGQLFRGSLLHAETVAAHTSKLDPEGLPWLPLKLDRLQWVQMTAKDYCLRRLSV
jgi:hypothetical protein